jgi:ATP-dependent DNA helicase RecG
VKSSQKSSQKILLKMKENPNITTIELAEILEVSRRAIAKQIAKLKEEGKLKRVGPDKGGYWEVIDNG